MDIWNNLINDLWPPDFADDNHVIRYLQKYAQADVLPQAAVFPLKSDLGAADAAALQTAWDEHHRFTVGLLASLIFNPEDPAQWFVAIGLNKNPDKAGVVLTNFRITERRLAHVRSLLPEQPAVKRQTIDELLLEFIKVNANPAWRLSRWILMSAAALSEAGKQANASELLRELKGEPMTLLQRYLEALEQLMFAVEQAITEAIERPVTDDQEPDRKEE